MGTTDQENEKTNQTSGDESGSLGWMNDSLAWGTKARPGKKGLTLEDINLGIYGRVPEQSEEMTRKPRGAFHVPG